MQDSPALRESKQLLAPALLPFSAVGRLTAPIVAQPMPIYANVLVGFICTFCLRKSDAGVVDVGNPTSRFVDSGESIIRSVLKPENSHIERAAEA